MRTDPAAIRPPVHRRRPHLAVPTVAVAAVIAAMPVAAQPYRTYHEFEGRFSAMGDPGKTEVGPLVGSGTREFSTRGTVWDLEFNAWLDTPKTLPQLKSGVEVALALGEGWGTAEAIGGARADLDDTLTVIAQPGLPTGYLRFNWGLDGTMEASLRGARSYLRFFSWEYYQQTELFVTGSTVPRTTLFSEIQRRTTVPTPPQAEAFNAYLPFGNPINEDRRRSDDVRQISTGVGALSVVVPMTPGTAVDLSFHLLTLTSLALENGNYTAVDATHGLDMTSTATLASVELLDADGAIYPGPWSLESAGGIGYPIAVVPEPATALLALAGIAVVGGAVVASRRRQRAG